MSSYHLLNAVAQFLLGFALAFSSHHSNSDNPITQTLFDRFRPTCPASFDCIRTFDGSIETSSEDEVWVAVYRSINNSPSVILKDDFMSAMRSATTPSAAAVASLNTTHLESPLPLQSPVAIARLLRNEDESYVLDCLRCSLRKEKMDASCDGGSEHCEALSVAIDALVEHYCTHHTAFDGIIRTKATLMSAPLLEARGFVPVTKLSLDMASHTSCLDACLSEYAKRSVSTSLGPAARESAMSIVSRLGMLDRDADVLRSQESSAEDDESDPTGDPWAGMKQFI